MANSLLECLEVCEPLYLNEVVNVYKNHGHTMEDVLKDLGNKECYTAKEICEALGY